MRKLVFLLAASFLWCVIPSKAGDVYISQNGGAFTGGSACNGQTTITPSAVTWTPGNTYHLCGTFTGSANANPIITINASGTSASPIIVLFDAGAILQAPYFGTSGAINMTNQSWVIIDGGGTGVSGTGGSFVPNGIIQNTADGTHLAYQAPTRGINMRPCDNCVVRNLEILNLYVHSNDGSGLADNSPGGAEAVYFGGSNTQVYNNLLHDIATGIYEGYTADSGNSFYNNEIYNCNHGIEVGNSNGTVTGTSSYNNYFHDFGNWDTTADAYHHDGIFYYAVAPATNSNGMVYNNQFGGDFGNTTTAHLYFSGYTTGLQVFNNMFSGYAGRSYALVEFGGTGGANPSLYNNTFIGSGDSNENCVQIGAGIGGVVFENNAVTNCGNLMYTVSGVSFSTIDHNIYAAGNSEPWQGPKCPGGRYCTTLASWQAATGQEAHSQYVVSAKLSAAGIPQAGSAVVGAGANLTSLGVVALDTDKNGSPRPTSGAWNAGAYQSGTSAGLPAPPTGLVATVQ